MHSTYNKSTYSQPQRLTNSEAADSKDNLLVMFGRAVLGSCGAVLGSFNESEQEEREYKREERFILNLTRMTEETSAVFPEHFMEFCVHLTNENVKELVAIESGYTSILFNDEEFAFPACSMEYFIKKFEKAKVEENDAFLLAMQKVHRKARLVLDRPGIKDRIRKCIAERAAATKKRMFFKAFYSIAKFFERFGDDPIGLIFSRTLSDIATPSNFLALMPASGRDPPPTSESLTPPPSGTTGTRSMEENA